MTITCNQLDDLLLEGDHFSLEVAARHAQSCDACMEKLAELERDLRHRARPARDVEQRHALAAH